MKNKNTKTIYKTNNVFSNNIDSGVVIGNEALISIIKKSTSQIKGFVRFSENIVDGINKVFNFSNTYSGITVHNRIDENGTITLDIDLSVVLEYGAILISCALNYEHISEISDGEGRFVSVTGRIKGSEITILNVYAPPRSDWLFYRSICDLIVDSQGMVVCGGDFNIRLNPKLDFSSPSRQNSPLISKVNSYIEEMGIIDVWRELYPSIRDFTHNSVSHTVYAKIDNFFMFNADRFKIRDCDILTRDFSDRSPISISLLLAGKKRNPLWKLNSHIFNDPAIVSKIKEDIKEYLEIKNAGEVPPVI